MNYHGKPNQQIQVDCESASALGCAYIDYELPSCSCDPGCDIKTKQLVWVANPKFKVDAINVYFSLDC